MNKKIFVVKQLFLKPRSNLFFFIEAVKKGHKKEQFGIFTRLIDIDFTRPIQGIYPKQTSYMQPDVAPISLVVSNETKAFGGRQSRIQVSRAIKWHRSTW